MYIRTVSSLSKKTALPGSFSVLLTRFVYHRRLVRFHCLVHCPCLCSFSSALCIVQCPVGTPSLFLFPKRVERPNPKLGLHRTRTRRLVSPQQTGTGTGIIGCGGASAAVHEGGGFGSGGEICEETVRACCRLLIAKTLPDCLPLHLLYPAVI